MGSTNLSRNTGHGLLNWSLNIRSSSEINPIWNHHPNEHFTYFCSGKTSTTFTSGTKHLSTPQDVVPWIQQPSHASVPCKSHGTCKVGGGNFFMVHSKVDGWMLDRDSKHEWNQRDFHKGSQCFMLFSARFAQRISFFRGKSDGISHDVLKYEIFSQTWFRITCF